jgi:serine O-acetyltransferase
MKKNLADRGFLVKNYQTNAQSLPINRGQVVAWLSDLLELLFPAFQTAEPPTPSEAEKMVERLDRELHMILTALIPAVTVEMTANGFFSALEDLYGQLMRDAQALEQGDPAAESLEEVLIAYPGFLAIAVYRLAHRFWELKVPTLPRVLTEWAHEKTGIDIHPGAQLGHPVVIDHGTGIVIGESTIIGNHVKLYQGVTLGALSVDKSLAATKRHPTIEDEVTIYANATILGGETVIGRGSVIGGNTWITGSIPPNSLVFHQSEIQIRTAPGAENADFSI